MKASQLPLPEFAETFLRYAKTTLHKQVVWQLHRWLKEYQIDIDRLTTTDIDAFLKKPARKDTSPSTRRVYSRALQHYLRYLQKLGHPINCVSKPCPQYSSLRPTAAKIPLPDYATTFLCDGKHGSSINSIGAFHRWLQARGLEPLQIGVSHILEFLKKPCQKTITKRTSRSVYAAPLLPYLAYLHENKLLRFNPAHTQLHPKFLPPSARQFLEEIAVTLKPGTVRDYEQSLRAFYAHLKQHTPSIYDLEREYVVAWLKALKDRNLHPSTRRSMVGQLRVYLRWLCEHDMLRLHPDELVRSGDFPKLPDYLPRPLSPNVDKGLQKFLLSGKFNRYRRGLWLMHKTGIRIGELESLAYDCVRTDQLGNTFLKVPLGKLNNERLVPIATETAEIIAALQQRQSTNRRYLLFEGPSSALRERLYHYLIKASKRLKLPRPIQSHQLRHTCATELINSGMSLTSIMSFLGHKDFRMTLRYAKITQQTVVQEFQRATQYADKKYEISSVPLKQNDGVSLISDLIRYCHRYARAGHIIKRLHRLKGEISRLERTVKTRT